MTATAAPFELRVLDGEQRGASVAVRPDVPLSVSGLWHSDVVLRSPAAALAEAELRLHDGAIELHVKQGDVKVDGALLAAGARTRVPLYAPIVIGDTAVALGEMGAGSWSALFQPAPQADGDAAATAAPDTATAPRRRIDPRRLVLGGGALAAVSLAVFAFASLIAPPQPSAEQRAQRAQTLLRTAGLNALTVKAAADGQLEAGGWVATQAQRDKAEALLAGAGLQARGSPWIDEQVVSAVQDVFRVNGVTAEVASTGPGAVRVLTAMADTPALQRLEATARRDVQGLAQLDVRNTPPPRTPSAVPAIDDPGKRVASIVGGETPYVVTADGSRYFVGGLLPTGHRIQSIDAKSVQLEREGQLSTLAF